MSEPIYEYVRGQGWVVNAKPDGRHFTWNERRWLITMVEVAPAGIRNWQSDASLVTMSIDELVRYAVRNWRGDPGFPGTAEPRLRTRGLYLHTFTLL